MDGNGRWAKKRGVGTIEGHKKGGETAERIALTAKKMGIKYLTLYTFSAENWRRSPLWIAEFIRELSYYLEHQTDIFMQEHIRARFIGDHSRFPQKLQRLMRELEEKTAYFDDVHVTFAVGYGARQEIAQSMRALAKRVGSEEIKISDINEQLISETLYTHDLPDPDVLIRTSGEMRISNYLLWQAAYAELYFTETLWPDFSPEEFTKIIETCCQRQRCYGQDRQDAANAA